MKPNPNIEDVTNVPPLVALTLDAADPPALPILEALPPEEETELQECEREIEDWLNKGPIVAARLATVREKRLFRKHFKTFEEYCFRTWHFKAHRARQMCRGFAVLQNIGWDGNPNTLEGLSLPLREGYWRILNRLPADKQADAWQQAVATAPDRGMSMKHLESVVERLVSVAAATSAAAIPPAGVALPPPKPLKETREEMVIEQADMVCKEIQTLADLAGTADSVATGELTTALEIVQRLRTDVEQKRLMQKTRPTGPPGERAQTSGPFRAQEEKA